MAIIFYSLGCITSFPSFFLSHSEMDNTSINCSSNITFNKNDEFNIQISTNQVADITMDKTTNSESFLLLLPLTSVTCWIILLGLPIFIFYWRWSRSRFVRLINALPGASTTSLLGNFADLKHLDHTGILMAMHLKWPRRYGSIYRFWVGTRPMIVITSPELMEPILSSHKLITKSRQYSFFKPWIGESVALSTGEKWKARRRLLTPAFHFKILESALDVFNEKSLDCANKLEKIISTKNSHEVDVYSLMTEVTLDIVCESLMAHPAKDSKEKIEYGLNIRRFGKGVVARITNPLMANEWIFRMSPLGRDNKKCVEELHNFTDNVIKNRREVLQKTKKPTEVITDGDKKVKLTFLDLLIKAAESGEANYTNEDIRGEVDTFMAAGHDTTASAMSWFLYCIARHPEEQERVIEEVDQVFGTDKDRPCTNQDLAELKYLECCIKETLRLYPSGPNVMRNLTEDVDIGNYKLPAGATVVLGIYGLHHNPDVYPDPESFKPERFLPEQSEGRHHFAFIPFSAGPRNCIGQKYAMMEMKTVLSNLLRRFHFSSLEDPTQPLMIPSTVIVLKPKDGINLIIKRRS